MSYAAAVVFVLLAVICLVAGLVIASGAAFLVAAIASAGAVLVLAAKLRTGKRTKTFVTEPPLRRTPSWRRHVAPEGSVADGEPADSELAGVIDGYHELLASEILPLLETLSVDELRRVLTYERSALNRQVVIDRVEDLIALTEGPAKSTNALVDPSAPTTTRRRRASTGRTKS